MRIATFLTLLALLLISMPSYAQDESNCDPAAIVQEYQPRMNEAETLDDLSLIVHDIRWDIAICNGLVFTGETGGLVIPVALAPGTYIVELLSSDYFYAGVDIVAGDCDGSSALIRRPEHGDVTQEVYQAGEGGCRLLITMSDVWEPPYEIRFLAVE